MPHLRIHLLVGALAILCTLSVPNHWPSAIPHLSSSTLSIPPLPVPSVPLATPHGILA